MPTSEQILNSLHQISNAWQVLAIIWHVYFGVLAGILLVGNRPSPRMVGVLLAMPLLSVSGIAWASMNPFTGIVFALAGIALVMISNRLPGDHVQLAPAWAMVVGTGMIVFGWVYPHFLDTASFLPYLYSAPTGLIPCPTLSIVIGIALILGGLGSRLWSLVLGATGVFYAFFGAIRLGVTIDWILLAGSLAIILMALSHTSDRRTQRSTTMQIS